MKKSFIYIALIAIAGVAITSCASKKPAPPVPITDNSQKLPVPPEIEVIEPCSDVADSDASFLRVRGVGTSTDRTMSKDRAEQAALANLATKLAGVASMENMRVAVSTNAEGAEQFHDKMVAISKVIAYNVSVAGYRTSCEKRTVSQNGAFNTYVVLEFGKQELVKQMLDLGKKEGHIRADFDFDRYMRMMNENIREYEKNNR
jgi:hypothetical protein